jgi:hypothetical protein
MKLPLEAKKQFAKYGKAGGRKAAANLTDAERKERARQAGIASGKARKKKSNK